MDEMIAALKAAGAPQTLIAIGCVAFIIVDKILPLITNRRVEWSNWTQKEREILSGDERTFREALMTQVATLRRDLHDARAEIIIAQEKLKDAHEANIELKTLNAELRAEIARMRALLKVFEERFGTLGMEGVVE